jgi:hypothetical protein
MVYQALKQLVPGRGVPPDGFLDELVSWGRFAPSDIFLPPDSGTDVYTSVFRVLGPWRGLQHRRAVMLEIMRVLAGFESSWRWGEGVDVTNPRSNTATTAEAGAWQVSADSMAHGQDLRDLVLRRAGAVDGITFQRAMKQDHQLAMEYIARLLCHTVRHNGPVRDGLMHPHLKRDAVQEFQALMMGDFPNQPAVSLGSFA